MNRESGIFGNEFVRNDSCKNRGNSQKFIWRDTVPPAHAPPSVCELRSYKSILVNRYVPIRRKKAQICVS